MKRFIYAILISAAALPAMVKAQNAITMYQMPWMHQRTMLNPAFTPYSKGNLSLVLFPVPINGYVGLENSFSINDLYEIDTDDSLVFGLDNFVEGLSDNNYLTYELGIDLFNLGFKAGEKNYFGLNISTRVNTSLRYPGDLMKLLIQGNAAHLDETMNFNLGVNATAYGEIGVLYNRQINDDLTVGTRLKYLKGIGNIYTEKSDLTLHTSSDDYTMTMGADVIVNMSTPVDLQDSSDARRFSISGNNGFAIDLGGEYKFKDDWTFSASIIDLGSIKWKENTLNLVSSGTNEFTFDGIDVDLLNPDSTSFEGLLDSIASAFDFDTTRNAYKSKLPTRFMLGASYNINTGMDAAAIFHGKIIDGKVQPALTLVHNTQAGRWFNFGLSYTMKKGSFANLGMALRFNAGIMQWFVVTDNIVGALVPTSAQNVNIQGGFYFTFGRPDEDELAKGDKNFDVDPEEPVNDPEKNDTEKTEKKKKDKTEKEKTEKEKSEKQKKSTTGRKTLPVIE